MGENASELGNRALTVLEEKPKALVTQELAELYRQWVVPIGSVGDIKKGGESEVKDELEKRLEALLDEAIGVTVQGRPPLEARVRDKRVMENRDVIAYNIIAITHDRAVISQIPGYKYPSPKNTSRADDTIMETVFVEQVPVKKENLCEFFLTSIPG